MKKIFIFCGLLLSFLGYTQYKTLWSKEFGGSNKDLLASSLKTSDNNYIFIGSTNSHDGDVSANLGGTDIFVNKIDSNGNYLWKKTYGGNQDDVAIKIINSNDGGYVLLSKSKSNNGLYDSNNGGFDIWVTKLDLSGDVVWKKHLGGSGEESSADIIKVNTDYILSVTTTSKDFDFEHVDAASQDVWFFKISDAGSIQWKKRLQGSEAESLTKISLKDDSNVIALINSNSSDGDFSNNSASSVNKGFLFDIDGNSNISLVTMVDSDNPSYSNYGTNFKMLDDGYIIIGREDVKYSSSLVEDFNASISKYSFDGVKLWKKFYSSGDDPRADRDEAQFVDTTNDDGVVVFGYSRLFTIYPWYSWILKLDKMGNEIKLTKLVGADGGQYIVLDVNKDPNTGIFVLNTVFIRGFMPLAGAYGFRILLLNKETTSVLLDGLVDGNMYKTSTVFTGYIEADDTVVCFGDALRERENDNENVRFFKFKYYSEILLASSSDTKVNIGVYPNPVVDVVYLSKKVEKYNVIDLNGRLLLSGANVDRINIRHLPKGNYILQVLGSMQQSIKIVKK